MPSKNPRLSVVLSPAVASTLAALSQETGDSASSLVRGLLDQAAPALERMLELVRAAKAAKGQIGEGVRGSMDRVIDDLHDALAVADARTGRVVADLVSQAEAVKGRRRRSGQAHAERAPGGAAPASTPVPVTRGSGTPRRAKSGVIAEAVEALGEAGRLSARDVQKLTGKPVKAGHRGRL
jgi:hypothetical protein